MSGIDYETLGPEEADFLEQYPDDFDAEPYFDQQRDDSGAVERALDDRHLTRPPQGFDRTTAWHARADL